MDGAAGGGRGGREAAGSSRSLRSLADSPEVRWEGEVLDGAGAGRVRDWQDRWGRDWRDARAADTHVRMKRSGSLGRESLLGRERRQARGERERERDGRRDWERDASPHLDRPSPRLDRADASPHLHPIAGSVSFFPAPCFPRRGNTVAARSFALRPTWTSCSLGPLPRC